MPIVRTFLLLRFVFDSSMVWFLFLLLQPFGWSPSDFFHDIRPLVEKSEGEEEETGTRRQTPHDVAHEEVQRRDSCASVPDHDFFEVKGDVRRLVFNQSCSSNTNRLVSFMVWITNLLSSPFIQPSVGHFGNLISSHEVLPKCMSRRRMKGEERKGKDS